MSWFTNLLVSVLSRKGASDSRSYLKNQAESLLNKYTGAGLTGAEQEANQFTAEQMDLANQRNVFNYQNRYQWEVADMEKAGLNPALLYGGSSGAGSVGSASAGSSVSPAGNGLSDLIGSIMDIALLKAQIANINADTRNKSSEAAGREIENQFKPELLATDLEQGKVNIENTKAGIDLILAQLSEVASRTDLNSAQANEARVLASESEIRAANEALRSAGIEANNELIAQQVINAKCEQILKVLEQSLIKAQTSLAYFQSKSVNMDVVYKEFQTEFRDTFGANPDQNLWSAATGMLGKAASIGGNALDKINNKIEKGLEDAGLYLYKSFKKIVK